MLGSIVLDRSELRTIAIFADCRLPVPLLVIFPASSCQADSARLCLVEHFPIFLTPPHTSGHSSKRVGLNEFSVDSWSRLSMSNIVRWEAINWFRETLQNKQALLSYHLFLEDAETTAKGGGSQSYQGIALGEGVSQASKEDVRLILLIEGTGPVDKYQRVFDVMFWDAGYMEQRSQAPEYRLMCSMSSLYS